MVVVELNDAVEVVHYLRVQFRHFKGQGHQTQNCVVVTTVETGLFGAMFASLVASSIGRSGGRSSGEVLIVCVNVERHGGGAQREASRDFYVKGTCPSE